MATEAERWQQLEDLYHCTVSLQGQERAIYLSKACAGDDELRREIESMLSAHQKSGTFLESPAFSVPRLLTLLDPADSNDAEIDAGEIVSHYRVLEKIGRGGMGVVYKAEDLKLGRFVALKFLTARSLGQNAEGCRQVLERFEREARTTSALDHPNICVVYEVDEWNGSPFIAMQFLQGKTLKDEIALGALPAQRVAELGTQIADALEAAHGAGVIHRDIKPANIFVNHRGEVKVLDFGVAKLAGGKSNANAMSSGAGPLTFGAEARSPLLTIPGEMPGTVAYMSPEQIHGAELDGRSDIFSCGVVLYEMASGRNPFVGQTTEAVCESILHQTPTAVSELNPAVPIALEQIIGKAITKDRKDRYQAAAALQDDLRKLKQTLESGADATQRSLAATRRKFAVGLMALVLAAAFAGYGYSHRSRPIPSAERGSIILADFSNTTGEPIFDQALKEALRAQLEQSPFLNVVSDVNINRQLRFMGRAPDSRLTSDISRELCLRIGGMAILSGQISRLGDHYAIAIDAVDCQNGYSLGSEQVEAKDRNEVLGKLAGAATQLRIKLGESIASVQKYDAPIEQVTTTSLEALEAYGAAIKIRRQEGDAAVIPYFTRATELDPNFAMAYVNLGVSYANLNLPEKARKVIEKAYLLRGKVSERERFLIESHYYDIATGEYDKAIQTYRLWQQLYPKDLAPYVNLGTLYNLLGQHEQNVEEQLQVLRLDPSLSNGYSNLANAYLCLNQVDKAKAVVAQAKNRNIDNPLFWQVRYEIAFLSRDPSQLEREFATSLNQEQDGALAFQADTEAYYGHLARARELTERAAGVARRQGDRESAIGYQMIEALREADFGNVLLARKELARSFAGQLDDRSQVLAALVLARTGDSTSAREITAKLSQRFPSNTLVDNYWVPTVLAAAQLGRDPHRAIELLDATTPYELGLPQTPTNAVPYPIYIRGLAFLEAGDGLRAAREFQKIVDHSGIVGNYPLGALAQLGLARAYLLNDTPRKIDPHHRPGGCIDRSQTGADRFAAASQAYQGFLALWDDADPEIPVLRQARAEYNTLVQHASTSCRMGTR
jgi:eukaryotic-like serine/threonine-protein kinase